jgi:hypothetical protein
VSCSCSWMGSASATACKSQIFKLPSHEQETKRLESVGKNTRQRTSFVWPGRVASSLPVATSHKRIVWSLAPERSRVPSGVMA